MACWRPNEHHDYDLERQFSKGSSAAGFGLSEGNREQHSLPSGTQDAGGDIDAAAFKEVGYTLMAFGQKTYNGVATILRDPLTFLPDEEVRNIPGFEDPQSRLLATTVQVGSEKLRVINGYFPNGETVESEKFPYKLAWLDSGSMASEPAGRVSELSASRRL